MTCSIVHATNTIITPVKEISLKKYGIHLPIQFPVRDLYNLARTLYVGFSFIIHLYKVKDTDILRNTKIDKIFDLTFRKYK